MEKDIHLPHDFRMSLVYLIDAIRKMPNYEKLKDFVKERIVSESPEINYQDLSIQAGIHQGVALVVLYDLHSETLYGEWGVDVDSWDRIDNFLQKSDKD